MSVEIKVPSLPESVNDAVVAAWHKKPGDVVHANEALLDLETDKVVLEVPAAEDGILEKILVDVDAVVITGQTLGLFKAQTLQSDNQELADQQVVEVKKQHPDKEESKHIMPAAKRLINTHHLDITQLHVSGDKGQILKEDVLAAIEAQKVQHHLKQLSKKESQEPSQTVEKDISTNKPNSPLNLSEEIDNYRMEKRIPMTRLRKKIAERLVESQQTSAILTTFNEVDMQAVMDIRAKFKMEFEKKYQIKLGFMGFFVKATLEALKAFPVINARIEEDDIVYHGYYDIGIAVSSERGLVVPILRNVENMSITEIEMAIREYAQKARDNRLSLSDISGGTFSITNGGVFGSLLSTPIINPPQSAILGMHNINKKPVVVNDEIVIRPMMYLAVSYDHRLIDGRDAVQFLVKIKQQLEDPARILLTL